MPIRNILIKYWGYSTFRPMQEEIIRSVMEGNDTLALLPTGGGKSVCYQVPTLAMEGICLVITPLISLMKDQVESLKRKGIKAVAIYSGLNYYEIDIAFNNCIYGNVKFLYISPERLETEKFRSILSKLKICLIAVDEAHCISQWGYDFRPPYLKIAEIRKFLPQIPVLAVTATATPEVVKDIQAKLNFPFENVFQISFVRKNLTYYVIKEDDKLGRLIRILNTLKGSGIIYVRSRRKTFEIAQFLEKNNITASYYHAGLDAVTRDRRQNAWMREQYRIIVATNAFGMGIDKPNVRVVVHLDLPESLEAYFQEAGRAGRDELNASAILLYENSDVIDAQNNLQLAYPEPEVIKNVYQALGNYYQLAVGGGKNISFDFELNAFSNTYQFKPAIVFNSLKFLEREGYITLSDSFDSYSKIMFLLKKDELYRFQVENIKYDKFIKLILRSYSGVFTDFTKISEAELANRAEISKDDVIALLKKLDLMKVLVYISQKSLPQIVYNYERTDIKNISISTENYFKIKENAERRLQSVIHYTTTNQYCRNQLLLNYFGETDSKRCGKCDVCINRNKTELSDYEMDNIISAIKPVLQLNALSESEILGMFELIDEYKMLKAIQWLKDYGKIYENEEQKLKWGKKNH
ncbi:MAG TPA: ATP-dependent DNA helicase RecQ [Bacteroidales bacterium]|nr:ATP-dependent DNA helicase RecQ [Bacteroidales bacterium]